MPILISLMAWGDQYNPDTSPTPKKIITTFRQDASLLVADYQKKPGYHFGTMR